MRPDELPFVVRHFLTRIFVKSKNFEIISKILFEGLALVNYSRYNITKQL